MTFFPSSLNVRVVFRTLNCMDVKKVLSILCNQGFFKKWHVYRKSFLSVFWKRKRNWRKRHFLGGSSGESGTFWVEAEAEVEVTFENHLEAEAEAEVEALVKKKMEAEAEALVKKKLEAEAEVEAI